MRYNAVLCAGVAIASLAAAPARAETIPSPEQMYKMLLEQQRQIRDLEKRAVKAARELEETKAALRMYRGAVVKAGEAAATAKKDAEAARAAASAAEKKMATKEDLDRTRTELGTQPSRSVATIPTEKGGFFASGEWLHLKASVDDLGYAVIAPTGSTPAKGGTAVTLSPEFGSGFRIGGGYAFPGTGFAVALYGTYLDTSSSASVTSPGASQLRASLFHPDNSNPSATQIDATFDLNLFAIDIEASQKLRLGEMTEVRLIGGLRYARLNTGFSAVHTGASFVTPGIVAFNSRMWGIGPRGGFDLKWRLPAGFFVNAMAAGSILMSRQEASYESDRDGSSAGSADLRQSRVFQIIPVVESQLALGWRGTLAPGVSLNVLAGYQFQQWINANARVRFIDDVGESAFTITRESVGLHGPFVRAVFKFDNLGQLFGM